MAVHNRQNYIKWVRILVAPILTASFLDVEKGLKLIHRTHGHPLHSVDSMPMLGRSKKQSTRWKRLSFPWQGRIPQFRIAEFLRKVWKIPPCPKNSMNFYKSDNLLQYPQQSVSRPLIQQEESNARFLALFIEQKFTITLLWVPTKGIQIFYLLYCWQILIFTANFFLMLATCLASFIQIIHGKEYKAGSPYSLL